jgi:tetratricopeptide (TPR) repeat protein
MKRLTLVLLILTLAPASSLQAGETHLGKIDFPTSGSPEAREPFLRGVLFLHSFEYRDARDAFVEAQAIDPGFAMAYWGEAMTYNHPIWREENVEAAREALARLAPTPAERAAKAATEREKDYLETVEVLYGEGDKRRRDRAYSEALGALAAKYPDDLEAKSFYALSILGTCHDGRDAATYMRAAAMVEEVFYENPEHPGAAHYLIHSYDDAVHAPLGLRPARVYARIAPDAEHALHMPSHIFLALGMWDETVASNVDSWEAGERRVARDDLPSDRRGYHALLWLHYAYLQQGRIRDAEKLLDVIRTDAEKSGSVRARTHFALMRSAHVVETESWPAVPAGPDLTDLPAQAAAADLFATGFAAVAAAELDAARAALEDMQARIAEAESEEDRRGYSSGYASVAPARTAEARAMARGLEGRIRLAEGKNEEALELLARAVEIEDGLPFGFGPPVPVKPSHELLGEALLSLGRAGEARRELEIALARAPRRARSVLGLIRAARQDGAVELAEDTSRVLDEIWDEADPGVRKKSGVDAAP